MTTTTTKTTNNVAIATEGTVVQHNTVAYSAQAAVNTRKYIEELVTERECWEQNAYRTSNDQLYQLLARCYELYKLMEGHTDEAKQLRSAVTDYINTKGLVFAKGTHTLAKIVKCVFGADRRRVSAYSIVLRTALANGLRTEEVADFIRRNGGVEEIRLHKAPNAMTAKQKAQQARAAAQSANLGMLTSAKLVQMVREDVGRRGQQVVLIGTFDDDGNVIINATIESDGVLNAALANYYSSHKKAVEEFVAQQKEQQRAQATNDAITAAAAAAA